jgi:hypothetical protein
MNSGNEFRDRIGSLLRTRYDNVRTEVNLSAKKADIYFEIKHGPRRTIRTAVECKDWARGLTRDDVRTIVADYQPALNKNEIDELWIISAQTPAPGARTYVESYSTFQLMTALEFEQSIIDFIPLITFLKTDFHEDRISKYFIAPNYYVGPTEKADLHRHISQWLASETPKPIALWGGYGMGKTSYARFLAAALAERSLADYQNPLPILINLGEFTTAPNIEALISSQLTNYYGVRHFSSSAFNQLNKSGRFILIFDSFDEMKFAMAPNDFAYFSAELRKLSQDNPRLILLGRPDVIESDEDAQRLLTSKMQSHHLVVRADDAPDFENVRLAFLSVDQYFALVEGFLRTEQSSGSNDTETIQFHLKKVADLNLGDILERPVQAKMLAEILTDLDPSAESLSRFSLYDIFIRKILRREEEKAARRFISIENRLRFMRHLAWWLWTAKRTRTFTSLDIPLEIIQKFQIAGIELDALRRELLVGSIVEERNVGRLLSEKLAGVFYFPHTSFTEFLVADYLMSDEFSENEADRIPHALIGEVPTFLSEHPSGRAHVLMYERIKKNNVAQTSQSIKLLLADPEVRGLLSSRSAQHPWDVCLKYLRNKASDKPLLARSYLLDCLNFPDHKVFYAALVCAFYEEHADPTSLGSVLNQALLAILHKVGFDDLENAVHRGGVATSSNKNAAPYIMILNNCVRILPRDEQVLFDFNAVLEIATKYIGRSCIIDDVIPNMRTLINLESRRILAGASEKQEKKQLKLILLRGANLNIVPLV